MGRSPVLATRSTTVSRPALRVMSPASSAVRISPGIMLGSPDGLVNADQLGAIRKGGLHLDLPNHLRHAVHDLVTCQYVCAGLHEVGNRASVPRAFHDRIADERHGLRVIQLNTTLQAPPRHHGSHGDQQLVELSRSQIHQQYQTWGRRGGRPAAQFRIPLATAMTAARSDAASSAMRRTTSSPSNAVAVPSPPWSRNTRRTSSRYRF